MCVYINYDTQSPYICNRKEHIRSRYNYAVAKNIHGRKTMVYIGYAIRTCKFTVSICIFLYSVILCKF